MESTSPIPTSTPLPYTFFDEYKAAHWIAVFGFGILFIFGIISNIMSIIVLRCASFRKSSISFSLTALSCIYIAILFFSCLRQWILAISDRKSDFRLQQGICQIGVFGVYFLGHMAAWTLSLIVVERVFIVWFPFFARVVCSKKNTKIVWSVMTVVLFLVNCHFFFTFDYDYIYDGPSLTEDIDLANVTHSKTTVKFQNPSTTTETSNTTQIIDSKNRICYIKPTYRHFFNYIWPYVDMTLLTILPFVILLCGNAAIIIAIARANGFRKRSSTHRFASENCKSKSDNLEMKNKSENRMSHEEQHPASNPSSSTFMLMGMSIVHLFLTSPSGIYFMIIEYLYDADYTEHGHAKYVLFFVLSLFLLYLNDSVNFIVYYITGSKFRQTFKEKFSWRESSGVRSSNA